MILGHHQEQEKVLLQQVFAEYFIKTDIVLFLFKAQNMALNSFVTKDGLEIGRSQGVQAAACKIQAEGYMNPLFLKPCGNNKIQVILNGKSVGNMSGYDFSKEKPKFQKIYFGSLSKYRKI